MSQRIQLIQSPTFEGTFSSNAPPGWTAASVTNTTVTQLLRTDPPSAASRAVFSSDLKSSDYIYKGDAAYRATIASGAAADNFQLRQNAASAAGKIVEPLMRMSATVTARCSVLGNLLTVGVVGVIGTTDTLLLRVQDGAAYRDHGNTFEFTASTSLAAAVDVTLHPRWKTYGFHWTVPATVTSVSIRLSNGSSGAQVIDLGEVSMYEISGKK